MTTSSDFRSILTLDEVGAIEWWLNVGSRLLREHTESDSTDERLEELSSRFDSALAKAPIFSGVVYRGTAASPLWRSHVDELHDLIASSEPFVAPRHLSASLSEDIGHGHCYVETNDPPRQISVWLVCRVNSARLLQGFVHRAKDEQEVVLTRGSRFKRLACCQLPSPRPNQELWRIDLEQVA